jgi:LmbE family N-acetylglucosaminyl deacetylase
MMMNKKAAVVVAHPDDETLWVGGTILMDREHQWEVVALCRKSDADRAPRFLKVMEELSAVGHMADMNDEPDLPPLDIDEVKRTILDLLSGDTYNIIFTHSPYGEYTTHLRHEEASRAVYELWAEGSLEARELRMFAYDDGNKSHLPRAIEAADIVRSLPQPIWQKKYDLITKLYNFPPDGFEAKTTPKVEAFWRLQEPGDIKKLKKGASR